MSRWMRAHPLRILGAATLLLITVGVLGNHYAPGAHVWIFVILISSTIMPQFGNALGRNRQR